MRDTILGIVHVRQAGISQGLHSAKGLISIEHELVSSQQDAAPPPPPRILVPMVGVAPLLGSWGCLFGAAEAVAQSLGLADLCWPHVRLVVDTEARPPPPLLRALSPRARRGVCHDRCGGRCRDSLGFHLALRASLPQRVGQRPRVKFVNHGILRCILFSLCACDTCQRLIKVF